MEGEKPGRTFLKGETEVRGPGNSPKPGGNHMGVYVRYSEMKGVIGEKK